MKNTPIKEGQIAPEFCLPDPDEKDVCLADFPGNWVILYFYPKDNTPGCSLEASDFTRLKRDFESESARIIGVSKDHENFSRANLRSQIAIHTIKSNFLRVELPAQPLLSVGEILGLCGQEPLFLKERGPLPRRPPEKLSTWLSIYQQ